MPPPPPDPICAMIEAGEWSGIHYDRTTLIDGKPGPMRVIDKLVNKDMYLPWHHEHTCSTLWWDKFSGTIRADDYIYRDGNASNTSEANLFDYINTGLNHGDPDMYTPEYFREMEANNDHWNLECETSSRSAGAARIGVNQCFPKAKPCMMHTGIQWLTTKITRFPERWPCARAENTSTGPIAGGTQTVIFTTGAGLTARLRL